MAPSVTAVAVRKSLDAIPLLRLRTGTAIPSAPSRVVLPAPAVSATVRVVMAWSHIFSSPLSLSSPSSRLRFNDPGAGPCDYRNDIQKLNEPRAKTDF